MTTVIATEALCPPGLPASGWIAIDDGRIVDVGDGRAPRGATDVGDAILVPGFVDLQVNGVGEHDFADPRDDTWLGAARALVAHGVTACCPTLVSAPLDRYPAALDAAARARDILAAAPLPAILGVHLEGPFLGGAPGAHPIELLRPADLSFLQRVLGDHPGLVRIVTLAPEADPALDATRWLSSNGVVVALGHSTASYDAAIAAAGAGASIVTHLFNGMGPLHHRDPGLAGAALTDERLTPTLIADLVHVHPAVLRLAIAAKTRVALVSDAVAVRGAFDVQDGAARLADGTLAGAIALLDQAVANVVSLGVPISRAVAMATLVPADLVGQHDRGRLEQGAVADAVALDPRSLAVRQVWVRGKPVLPGELGSPST